MQSRFIGCDQPNLIWAHKERKRRPYSLFIITLGEAESAKRPERVGDRTDDDGFSGGEVLD